MSVKEIRKLKRYKLVAPDGGWGYVIWIAITINMISTVSFMPCLGMIYKDIYIQLRMDSTSISLLNGIGSMSVSIAGFITGPLLGCLSIRKLGLLAVTFLNLGTFAIIFVNSIELFFLSCGVLQSIGNGMLLNLSFTTLNQYFDKKRILTVAVTQTITAVVSLLAPLFVKWSAEEYGSTGTLIMMSGLYMHSFLAIVLMQPVKWHLKKIETEVLSEEKNPENKALLNHNETTKEQYSMTAPKLSDEKKDLSKEDAKKNSVFREMFSDFRDIPFLKSFLLSNASIGMAISAFSDVMFMTMLPQALYSMEWTEAEVAWAISLINFGDLVIKVICIFLNKIFLKFGSSEMFIVGLIMAVLTRLGFLWSDKPSVMLVFMVMMGLARGVIVIFYPLVIGEAVPNEKFTSAMGIFMLLFGIIFLVVGPLIGAVRDLTNSYGTAFYILTSLYGIVAMFWMIELLYKKNKDKRVKKTKSRVAA